MPAAGSLDPRNPEFDRFLHASVGEDRNGNDVTVLSTLARLNLEPWEEAAGLAALTREAAASRLDMLLSRFRDVPALSQDRGSVAQKLTRLLPKGRERVGTLADATTKAASKSWGAIWMVLAILFVVMQMMFVGGPGSGD